MLLCGCCSECSENSKGCCVVVAVSAVRILSVVVWLLQ